MNWEDYKRRFEEEAQRQGLSSAFVDRCLAYAERLASHHLPIIYDFDHLSSLLGFSAFSLYEVIKNPEDQYFSYQIPKRSAGTRQIDSPRKSLREIQDWILTNILNRCQPHNAAMAFTKGRSIKSNARAHVGRSSVLSLDIKDYFSSILPDKVIWVFKIVGYSHSVASALTGLTVLSRGLPQGAPTSPALSNLVMVDIDQSFTRYSEKLGIKYSRYADDLTFSGRFRPAPVIDMCRRILSRNNFSLNAAKTRLMLPHERQEVTGVVVNSRMQAPRYVRRRLRQELYYIEKFGLSAHEEKRPSLRTNRIDHLRGIAEYVLFLNPEDRDAKKAVSLLGRVRYGKVLTQPVKRD